MLITLLVKKANNIAVVGFTAMLLAILTLNCAGLSRPKKPSERNAEQVLEPSTTPEGTVKILYGDAIFFNLRNEIPPAVIEHLDPCITAELKFHLERHNEDVEIWMARNKNFGLKLPVSEGPIFLSNYEGADSYRVGAASIDGKLAKVPVSFSITDVMGTFQWIDVVLLHRAGNVWLLSNILFQFDSGDNYTLLDRIALVEGPQKK